MSDRELMQLISPWSLDATMPVPEALKENARNSLILILEALNASPAQAPVCLSKARALLPAIETSAVSLKKTRTPLSSKMVKSYDRYFQIEHVESSVPGISLIDSLVTMLDRFFQLNLLNDQPNNPDTLLQIEGLRQHTQLLCRVLELEPLE